MDDNSGEEQDRRRKEALDEIYLALKKQLRKIAHSRRVAGPPVGMFTTDLYNHLYPKLRRSKNLVIGTEAQFLAMCSVAYGNLIMDEYRKLAGRTPPGGKPVQMVPYTEDSPVVPEERLARSAFPLIDEAVLGLEQALRILERDKPRMAAVVRMKYYMGMKTDQIVEALGLSHATIERDLKDAKKILKSHLQPKKGPTE